MAFAAMRTESSATCACAEPKRSTATSRPLRRYMGGVTQVVHHLADAQLYVLTTSEVTEDEQLVKFLR